MATEKHDKVCIQDFGIDNLTAADGLAVGRPSAFVGETLENLLSGIYTVDDDKLYVCLSKLADNQNVYLEPSACASFLRTVNLMKDEKTLKYLKENNLVDKMKNAYHIVWATGGSLVPEEEMKNYYEKGKSIINRK